MCRLNLEISHSKAQLSPYFKASVGNPPNIHSLTTVIREATVLLH